MKKKLLSIVALAVFICLAVASSEDSSSSSNSEDNSASTSTTENEDPSTISSIESAKAFIEGKTFMATPAGGMAGLWHKVSFSNGRFTHCSTWPSAGEWTNIDKGNYTIVERRYSDTGQRYFSVEMTPDGEKNSYGCLAFVVNNTAFVDCLGNAATATIGDRNPWN